ncbi:MAG: formylglycine-generating enzyme family protein [bacterium]
MQSKLIFFFLSAFILFSCGVEDEEPADEVTDNDNDSVQFETPDFEESGDETDKTEDDISEKPDDLPEYFCYSGGAVLYEGEQQFKMCPGDSKQVLKQICKNGKWIDEGDCIPSYVTIPEGDFKMGCDIEKEKTCEGDNTPLHSIVLSEFIIEKFEVNVERYEECIAAGACNNENPEGPHYRTTDDSYSCNIGNSERKNHPANCVTWHGAKAFCQWIEMDLPTEAQWEKAARGAAAPIYPWGDSPEPDCDYAVMKTVSAGCGNGVTYPIGTTPKGASEYGLFDMSGNVSEYVLDWYEKNFYSDEEATKKDTLGPDEPQYDKFKVCRGGSYLYDERRTRAAFRSSCKFNDAAIDFGFRCATDKK